MKKNLNIKRKKIKKMVSITGIIYILSVSTSQVAQWWRTHLPMQEMRFQPVSWEEPLEKEMVCNRL